MTSFRSKRFFNNKPQVVTIANSNAVEANSSTISMTHSSRFAIFVLCLLAIGTLGCERDRGFRTKAVYRAPVNKLEISIDASGVVLAGHDVCEDGIGRVEVTSYDENAPASFQLRVAGDAETATYRDESGKTGSIAWNWRSASGSLRQLLANAGVTISSADELDECARVINNALAGPKGTTLVGQTKVIDAINVSAKYQ